MLESFIIAYFNVRICAQNKDVYVEEIDTELLSELLWVNGVSGLIGHEKLVKILEKMVEKENVSEIS